MQRFFSFVLFFAISLQAIAAETTPLQITDPVIEQDAFAEAVTTPNGFITAWNRGEASGPQTIMAQQFDRQRLPLKPPIVLHPKGIVEGRPELLRLNANTVAAFWVVNERVRGGLINLNLNKISGIKDIGVVGDLIHDVALMTNGNIAMVMSKTDVTNPSNIREKISYLILSPTLGILKNATSVHGQGFPLNSWNTLDHTITELNNGGLVLFRDRSTGNLMARSFNASGALLGSVYRINMTPMPLGTVYDIVSFNVKAVRLRNGAIAVVWTSMEGSGLDKWEIRARILDATGKPLGKDFRVNTSIAGTQLSPDVIALPNGGFCVTWVSTVNIERLYLYRSYLANGVPIFNSRISEQAGFYFLLPQETESVLLGDGALITVMDGYGFPGPLRADRIVQVIQ